MGQPEFRVHPSPRVIPHAQVSEGHHEPGNLVLIGNRAAAAVDADCLTDSAPAGVGHQPGRVTAARNRHRLLHQLLGPSQRAVGGLVHRGDDARRGHQGPGK